MTKIGRITLETVDGTAHATALYDLPELLRAAELFTPTGVYRQQRQDETGRWIYRYVRPLGDRPVETDLTDYRTPNDGAWDGPAAVVPPATFADVQTQFETLLLNSASNSGVIPASDVLRLFILTQAAWNHQPFSG